MVIPAILGLSLASAIGCSIEIDRVRLQVAPIEIVDTSALEGGSSVSLKSTLDLISNGQVMTSAPYPSVNIRGLEAPTDLKRVFADLLAKEQVENMPVLVKHLEEIRQSGVTFQGSSMNALSALGGTMSTTSRPDFEVDLGPGTIFVPDDSNYQNMLLWGTIRSTFSFQPDLRASLSPVGAPAAQVSGRTMCLNMGKKEPDGSVKYWPMGCSDKVILKLAMMTANARSVGTQDQARLWLYTDKASLADINKRLSPKVLPGYYVRALREVDLVGGMTEKDRKNKALYAPEFLFAPNGSPFASKYFFSHMAKYFPKETRAALERGHANEVNSLWDPNAAELKQDHVNAMMEHLLAAESDEVKLGMLGFLESRVPTSAMSTVKGLSFFKNVAALVDSGSESVAKRAAEVARKYGSPL